MNSQDDIKDSADAHGQGDNHEIVGDDDANDVGDDEAGGVGVNHATDGNDIDDDDDLEFWW